MSSRIKRTEVELTKISLHVSSLGKRTDYIPALSSLGKRTDYIPARLTM